MLEKDGIRDYNKHKLYTFSSKENVMLRQKYQDIRAALSAVDEEARRANMAKTDFLRRMRHDIPHQRHPGHGGDR